MVNLSNFKDVFDDEFLNRLNTIVEYLNKMGYTYEDSMRIARNILNEAKQLNKNNADTNARLDRELAKLTSDSEIIDARGNHAALSNRLNKYDYLVERPMLNNGKVILPSDFPEIPFNIYRKDKYNYVHDATPYNQFDWSDATEIFITSVSITGENKKQEGLDYDDPITFGTFSNKKIAGVYGNKDTFIFTIIDKIYDASAMLSFANGIKNALYRSASPSGKTLISRSKRIGVTMSEWASYGNGIFRSTITDGSGHTIIDVVNLKQSEWEYGLPSYYKLVSSISQVENTEGSFYQSGNNLYCNPHKTESPKFLLPLISQQLFTKKAENETIIFEDLIFLNRTTNFSLGSNDANIYFFDCGFLRGHGGDAFNTTGGKYNVFLLDCVAAEGSKDGFNYHTSDSNSLAVEINCLSHSNGKTKRPGDNQTTNSNNGSTAHDGMNMLRVGSHYWDCEGPIVADVNDCYSISIGVKVGSVIPTTTGSKSAFYLSGNAEALNPKYVIECMSYGDNIVSGIQAPQGNTYFIDFEGHEVITKALPLEEWS